VGSVDQLDNAFRRRSDFRSCWNLPTRHRSLNLLPAQQNNLLFQHTAVLSSITQPALIAVAFWRCRLLRLGV
jgi:hypothetical protein